MLGVANQEQGQTQQIRTVGCLDENRSGGGRAVREGFQKEIISAPGGGHGGKGAESLEVTAGSVWLNPKRKRPEVARAGLKSH